MKKISFIVAMALLLSSCGNGSPKESSQSSNLFLNEANQLVEKDVSDSLLGLWESEDFKVNDITYTIRWEVTESGTTLSKRCTDKNDRHWYAQVSLDYDAVLLNQSSPITPSSMPIATSTDKTTDISVMTDNIPCRASLAPANTSSQYIIASGTSQYDITDDSFDSGVMILSVTGQANSIKLIKIQNR